MRTHVYHCDQPIPNPWVAVFEGEESGPMGSGNSATEALNDLARQAVDELLEASKCAANILSLLDKEVKGLGLRAGNVPARLRAAIAMVEAV